MAEVAKFSMFFVWKPYKVDLAWVHEWLLQYAGSEYSGLTAEDKGVTVWFKNKPSDQIVASIIETEANITFDEMTIALAHRDKLNKAEKAAKAGLPYIQWNDMIPAERKLVLGTPLSSDDKEALLVKHPQQ